MMLTPEKIAEVTHELRADVANGISPKGYKITQMLNAIEELTRQRDAAMWIAKAAYDYREFLRSVPPYELGSLDQLLCYAVDEHPELFNKEVPDGQDRVE